MDAPTDDRNSESSEGLRPNNPRTSFSSSWTPTEIQRQLIQSFRGKFVGALMQRGLRQKAEKRFSELLRLWKQRHPGVPTNALLFAVFLRLAPEVQLKGGNRQPYVAPVTDSQQISFAVRWLVKPLREQGKTKNIPLNRLLDVLDETLANKGPAVAQKKAVYAQAALHRHRRLSLKYTN